MAENFTKRELEVLYQLLLGMSNKDISNALYISEHTTKAHLASIYKKLGVVNRVQATIKCFALFTKHNLKKEDLRMALEWK